MVEVDKAIYLAVCDLRALPLHKLVGSLSCPKSLDFAVVSIGMAHDSPIDHGFGPSMPLEVLVDHPSIGIHLLPYLHSSNHLVA